MKKIRVFILTQEGSTLKDIGMMKGEDNESLSDLKFWLEEKKVLNFWFQYWDPQECCRVIVVLELLNDIEDIVFMIFVANDNVDNFASMWQRVQGESDLGDSR